MYAAGGTFAAVFKSTDQGGTWTKLELPVGGTSDLYSLAIDPKGGGRLWVATEDGLLKTPDGGGTWTRVDRGAGNYLVQSLAIDPRDSARVMAGTGGDGVFLSRDGGTSWTSSNTGLAAGWVEALFGDPRGGALFAKLTTGFHRREGTSDWTEITGAFATDGKSDLDGIMFDVTSPQLLYAFENSKYWRSMDGGRRWQPADLKGPSMRDMMKGNVESAQFISMAQDPGNPKVLYAGSWSNDSPGGAVYKTTDGGKKWSPSGNGLPPKRLNLLRTGAPGALYAVVDGSTVFRTTNAGATWSAAGTGLPEAKVRTLAVSPKTASTVFVATEKGLFRSTDAAASWTRVGEGKDGIEGDDVAAVAVDPSTGTVFAASFHGVFKGDAAGERWTALRDGLLHQDVRALVIAGAPSRVWAGTAGGSVYSIEIP